MVSRRSFLLKSAATTVVAGATPLRSAWAQPAGANNAVRVAVVGLHGQGAYHVKLLRAVPGVRIVALCDVDEAVLEKRAGELAADGIAVAKHVDVRRLLEDKDIDAITIATPNHWHALMAIWACQAGKDVYVEKPVSHNVWEGRKLVEAAAKHGRIVQAGTQSRSDEALHELAREVRAGTLGRIVRARGFCYKRRESIGRVAGPQPIPAGVHYDLFCGPAPLAPLRRKQLHYDWHWSWATGNGDIGNQGVHEIDVCRWMLGEPGLPPRVFSVGGRFGYVDDGETPNTQVAVLDYPKAPLLFEVRGLPKKTGAGYEDHYRGIRIGYVIEGEDASFVGAAGGGWIHDREGKRARQLSGGGGAGHMENFFQAVRSRRPQDLAAPIEGAHVSSALCHLANISYRLGTLTPMDEVRSREASRTDVSEVLDRMATHLADNGVDLAATPPVLGPVLDVLPAEERFASGSEHDLGAFANVLARGTYRAPYVVPQVV